RGRIAGGQAILWGFPEDRREALFYAAMFDQAPPRERPARARTPDGLRTKPSITTMAKRARKAGATSLTLPDGTTLHFGEPESGGPADDSWPLDEFRTKETKQC